MTMASIRNLPSWEDARWRFANFAKDDRRQVKAKSVDRSGIPERNLHLIHPPPTPPAIHSKSSWFLRWAPDMCGLFGEFCWNDSFNFYITSLKSPGFGRNRLIFCWKQRRKYWCRETGLMVDYIFSSSVWGTCAETNAMETCATLTNETHAVGLEYGEAKPILVFVTACNSMEDHQSYIHHCQQPHSIDFFLRWLVLTPHCSQPIHAVQGVCSICVAHAVKHAFLQSDSECIEVLLIATVVCWTTR